MKRSPYAQAALLALALAACGESKESKQDPVDAAVVERVEPDAGPYFEGERYMVAGTHVNVVRKMSFTGLIEPGVALGFNLDDRVSPMGERESCGHGDLVDPEGNEGIDNQLAKVWEMIKPIVGPQVDALLQGAINEGRVLIMVELAGVDDLKNDDDVTVNVFRGALDPDVGTFGFIAPDQTFDYDYSNPISTATGAKIENGRVIAGPVTLQIPIAILDLNTVAQVHFGRIQLDIADDGTFKGFIGGALNVPEIVGELLMTGAAAETMLVKPFFENNADMVKVDGDCTYISIGVNIEGTTAFVLRDAAME
jgi:hypothetical protein